MNLARKVELAQQAIVLIRDTDSEPLENAEVAMRQVIIEAENGLQRLAQRKAEAAAAKAEAK